MRQVREVVFDEDGSNSVDGQYKVVLFIVFAAVAIFVARRVSLWWDEQTPWVLFFTKTAMVSGLGIAVCFAKAYFDSMNPDETRSISRVLAETEFLVATVKVLITILVVSILGAIIAARIVDSPLARAIEQLFNL